MNEPAPPATATAEQRNTLAFLGLRFRNLTLTEAADLLIDAAANGTRRTVFFVNAHCANVADRDPRYARLLTQADLLFADGSGMALAARLWGRRLRDNVNGTDLFPLLCAAAARTGVPLALFGAAPGVAESCAERMRAAHPGLDIVLTRHGYPPPEEESRLIADINRSGAGILLVAQGVPLQEHWIERHAGALETPVLMGVGALFDFYAGTVPRAPRILRRLGIEWAFRLLIEPRRLFSRYVLGNPRFILRTVRCRLNERRVSTGHPPPGRD